MLVAGNERMTGRRTGPIRLTLAFNVLNVCLACPTNSH